MGNELYISFDYLDYRKSKSIVLSSQVDALNSLKHVQKLKQINLEKMKYKILLHELFASASESLEQIDRKLPRTPKIHLEKTNTEVLEKPARSEKRAKMQGIESELREIQEKLRQLNN